MKKQINDILDYFESRKINEYKFEGVSSRGAIMEVNWEQDFIRCQCIIFPSENAQDKMQKQFEMTRQILIQNIQK
jgi:hypothetical protein